MQSDPTRLNQIKTRGFAFVPPVLTASQVSEMRALLQANVDEDLKKWESRRDYPDKWLDLFPAELGRASRRHIRRRVPGQRQAGVSRGGTRRYFQRSYMALGRSQLPAAPISDCTSQTRADGNPLT